MRPGVDALKRCGVPRPAGVGLHYVALLALVGGLLWIAVPKALDQVDRALGGVPTKPADLNEEVRESDGLEHDALVALQKWLRGVNSHREELVGPAVQIGTTVVQAAIGIFFVLAVAAYWIFERNRTIAAVSALVPVAKRERLRRTWTLIDLKLGAYVRGQGVLMLVVGAAYALGLWAVDMPYWLLLAALGGLLEVVPVIGPLATGVAVAAVGITAGWQTALVGVGVVLVVQMLENYVIVPRLLGGAVGLSPLVVLVAVTGIGAVLGGFAVLFAVPIAAVVATVVDVVFFDRDPGDQEVPTVLFPQKDAEAG
jgi:predicted PurR-regulated permease PerM